MEQNSSLGLNHNIPPHINGGIPSTNEALTTIADFPPEIFYDHIFHHIAEHHRPLGLARVCAKWNHLSTTYEVRSFLKRIVYTGKIINGEINENDESYSKYVKKNNGSKKRKRIEGVINSVENNGLMKGINSLYKQLFTHNKEITIAMLGLNTPGINLKALSLKDCIDEFKDDYDVVMAAIERTPVMLRFASDRMKRRDDLLLKACEEDPSVIRILSNANRKKVKILIAEKERLSSVPPVNLRSSLRWEK